MLQKKRRYAAAAVLLCVVIAGSGAGYQYMTAEAGELDGTYEEAALEHGDLELTCQGEGTTQVSVILQLPQFNTVAVEMLVSEVYVSSGDSVEEGDKLISISQETLDAAKEYYEVLIAKAEKAVEKAQKDYEIGSLEAEYTMESANVEAASANEKYAVKMKLLDQTVTEAQAELVSAQEQIVAYETNLANNAYYSQTGVEAKEAALQEAGKVTEEKKENYESAKKEYQELNKAAATALAALQTAAGVEVTVTIPQDDAQTEGEQETEKLVTETKNSRAEALNLKTETEKSEGKQTVKADSEAEAAAAETAQASDNSAEVLADLKSKVTAYADSYNSLAEAVDVMNEAQLAWEEAQNNQETAQKEFDDSKSQYEQAVKDAEQKKSELEGKLDSLEDTYEKALRKATTQKVSIKKELDTDILNGEYAKTTYENTVAELQKNLDDAKEDLEEKKEEQAALLAMKDGAICADQAGTLETVTYAQGDKLEAGQAIVSYSDESSILIPVEVEQADISGVQVKDTVEVTISGVRNGNLKGEVASIASEATSGGSMSNVTYTVTIKVDNSDGSVNTGSSAAVIFTSGELEDVDYIRNDALNNISGDTAKVKQKDANGEIVEKDVKIGEGTDIYTVIEGGLTKEDVCLIEQGGGR